MTVAMREVVRAIRRHTAGDLSSLVFDLDGAPEDPLGLAFAVEALHASILSPPNNLLPLALACEGSFACVVCDRDITDPKLVDGIAFEVIRWHLGRIRNDWQGEILDIDPVSYLDSLASEVRARQPARRAVERVAARYYDRYMVERPGVKLERPLARETRPVQLACQNVIVGLAALRHDPVFDGLRVESYATCEVAHLATGEADRALAGLLLCDAFQSGGTMEIRFGRLDAGGRSRDSSRPNQSTELPVPPALRRYARARGLTLGGADRHSISPAEARDLFLLVTPMSEDLRFYSFGAIDAGRISPERLCYALMAGIWRDIELTYLLATSGRATAILEGGSDPSNRIARSCEAESCRAALMVGLLLSRFEQASGGPGASAVRLVEDERSTIQWAINSDLGAVTFDLPPNRVLPWTQGSELAGTIEAIVVLPRAMPDHADVKLATRLQLDEPKARVFLLVPEDADATGLGKVPTLRCPQSLDLLDQSVRRKLDTMRNSRR